MFARELMHVRVCPQETHNESLMKSIVSLEEKLAKLSHLLVTGPDELRHGDGVTKKALVSIRWGVC